MLSICIGVYLFGYLMILNSDNLQEMIIWNQIQYLGLPFISVSWLMVSLLYTKTVYNLKNWMTFLFFIIPAATFVIRLTNPWHNLYYRSWALREFFGYPSLYMERGYWYYVNISHTVLCLFLAVIIYSLGYRRNRAGYTRPQFLAFLFASLFPLLGTMLVVFCTDKWVVDYSALLMPISLIIISYSIFKYDFLEIKTLARETIFENSIDGMVVLEPGLFVVDYNKAAKDFFTALNISLLGSSLEESIGKDQQLLEIFKSSAIKEFSVTMAGEERFYEIETMLLGDSGDENARMLKAIHDITDKRKAQEKLRILATTDSLTGLYNRSQFLMLARRELVWSKIHNEELSILMMDLDHFKNVNDSFGHAAGDEVIHEVGNIVKNSFRKTDIAGRLGGEEFAVILKNTSLKEAENVAEQFREAVARSKIIYKDEEIGITISIGASSSSGMDQNDNSIEEILKRADDALYMAKAGGRNCVATIQSDDDG